MNRLLVAAVVLVAGSTPAAAQSSQEPSGPPVVVTVGEGIIKRAPDRAWVTVTSESRAQKPKEAQEMNARKMSEVLAKLKGTGLADEAIQTVAYHLHPEYDYVDGKQTLRGYASRNTVQVRVDDLSRLGSILNLAVSAGATSVSGVRFDLQKRDAVEQEALRQAVADARARADALAAGAGLAVQRIIKIEEQRVATVPPPRPYQMAMRAEMADTPATPITPGEIEIRASVTLTSELGGPKS